MRVLQSPGAECFGRRLCKIPDLKARPRTGAETVQGRGELLLALLNCLWVDDPTVIGIWENRYIENGDKALTTTRLI
jgi:hypothetical protein